MKLSKLTSLYTSILDRIHKNDMRKAVISNITDKLEGMDDKELDIMLHCAFRIEDHRCLFLADPINGD